MSAFAVGDMVEWDRGDVTYKDGVPSFQKRKVSGRLVSAIKDGFIVEVEESGERFPWAPFPGIFSGVRKRDGEGG